MILLLVVGLTLAAVLPWSGSPGRAHLARRSDAMVQAVHERLSHRGLTVMSGAFVLAALVLSLVSGKAPDAILAGVGLVLVTVTHQAQPGALANATDELESRGLAPRLQRERSARRRRRQLQLGGASLALYVVGNALNLLDPEQTSTTLTALAVTCLVLAFVGLLALAIASVWVYGDEETDEPIRRT